MTIIIIGMMVSSVYADTPTIETKTLSDLETKEQLEERMKESPESELVTQYFLDMKSIDECSEWEDEEWCKHVKERLDEKYGTPKEDRDRNILITIVTSGIISLIVGFVFFIRKKSKKD
jgi:hypothetical protein